MVVNEMKQRQGGRGGSRPHQQKTRTIRKFCGISRSPTTSLQLIRPSFHHTLSLPAAKKEPSQEQCRGATSDPIFPIKALGYLTDTARHGFPGWPTRYLMLGQHNHAHFLLRGARLGSTFPPLLAIDSFCSRLTLTPSPLSPDLHFQERDLSIIVFKNTVRI